MRLVFDIVGQCWIDERVVKGEGFATDASYIKADAFRQRMGDGPFPGSTTRKDGINP